MKTGDKIVCIDVKGIGESKPVALTLYNTYTIVENDEVPIHNSYNIINDDNEIGHYWSKRFITLDKWREQQINIILDEKTL